MRHYSIVLNTDSGSRRSLRIANPNPNKPVEEISAAIDRLIANDVFDNQRGALESLNRMELTTVETTTVL
ncbi:MAG: DUF2922 domain-containing protein [Defluviitaleaceae bacterium]|nr:DUF2922 domain-containing protein [Defluviitaleaceae bacterium]